MKEKLNSYIKQIIGLQGISKQYIIENKEDIRNSYQDVLDEDKFEVVKGLIHKYTNRALIKVSYLCAAHCRFCTRIRQIGSNKGTLSQTDIEKIYEYLYAHPEIEDVIISGGDPFYTPVITNNLILKIKNIKSIKVLRIGTRLPFQNPEKFKTENVINLLKLVRKVAETKTFYILLHAEHYNELNSISISAIQEIKKIAKIPLFSQTVFLKGINDDFDVLFRLFKELYFIGVVPYYIYRCDEISELDGFLCEFETEKEIMRKLTVNLSGLACPKYIKDTNSTKGKIPQDLNFFENF